jgi:hypothetical protein
MEDVKAQPPECDHKFKLGKDGMLTCELCGFKQAPRKREPAAAAADPGGMSSQPIYMGPEPDTSKGAEHIKSHRRWDRVSNVASDIIDFVTFWD